MRDVWYGDRRDLVKWGVLLHLADAHKAKVIFHVAYYRPPARNELAYRIEVDGHSFPLPRAVTDHFRAIGNISGLRSPARVIVLADDCSDRDAYLSTALRKVRRLPAPAVVFLDPDTGLEPRRSSHQEHVRQSELKVIWEALRLHDVLVLYRHASRHKRWREEAMVRFEGALGLRPGRAKLAQGREIASDVAFLFAKRA